MVVNNEEHEEPWNKPWEVWAYEQCRDCSHSRYLHLIDVPENSTWEKGQKYNLGNCNKLVPDFGFCPCKEWMSPDNLEYIELLAKRKGLIKDEEDKI